MGHECCGHPLEFNLEELAATLTSWDFPFQMDSDRISMTLPGTNGDINFHISIIHDGDGRPCMMRLLAYSPDWSPLLAGVDKHALLHYLNHRNANTILGRHFMDEATGKAAFEFTVYSSHGVFEDDLKDLIWLTVSEADETVSHLTALSQVPKGAS